MKIIETINQVIEEKQHKDQIGHKLDITVKLEDIFIDAYEDTVLTFPLNYLFFDDPPPFVICPSLPDIDIVGSIINNDTLSLSINSYQEETTITLYVKIIGEGWIK